MFTSAAYGMRGTTIPFAVISVYCACNFESHTQRKLLPKHGAYGMPSTAVRAIGRFVLYSLYLTVILAEVGMETFMSEMFFAEERRESQDRSSCKARCSDQCMVLDRVRHSRHSPALCCDWGAPGDCEGDRAIRG